MKTCSTCKHWAERVGARHKACAKIEIHDDAGSGDMMLAGTDPDSVDLGDAPAFTIDGSGYKAKLVTAGDFGCTLHEAK